MNRQARDVDEGHRDLLDSTARPGVNPPIFTRYDLLAASSETYRAAVLADAPLQDGWDSDDDMLLYGAEAHLYNTSTQFRKWRRNQR